MTMRYCYSYLHYAEVEAVISPDACISAGGIRTSLKSIPWVFSVFTLLRHSVFVIVVVLAFLNSTYAFAEDVPSEKEFRLDFNKLMKETKNIKLSIYTEGEAPRNQKAFEEMSCSYFANDRKNIAPLIQMIYRSNPHADTQYYPKQNDIKQEVIEKEQRKARYVVEITLADSSTLHFYFGNAFYLGRMKGFITYPPQYEKFPIEVPELLSYTLGNWAKSLGKPMTVATSNVTQDKCDHYIDRMLYIYESDGKK
jgi:hypothetical protein